MLKRLLQGRPFGHPLHPLLVHLPIGLFVLSLVLDVIANWFDGGTPVVQGAFYTMALGALLGLVAAAAGFADFVDIRRDHPARPAAVVHMFLNLLVVGAYLVNLWLRSGALAAATVPWPTLILSAVSLAVLFVSGYLGGRLVYDEGIGVGRHRRRSRLPHDTLQLSEEAWHGAYVLIPGAAQLSENQSLRVQINDLTLVVVHHQNEFYAFQEFCTHRYGPLSEGRYRSGQVECPWHGSCFNMGTGEVTRGPAKLPLRTYPVVLSEGEVYVRTPIGEPELEAQPERAAAAQ